MAGASRLTQPFFLPTACLPAPQALLARLLVSSKELFWPGMVGEPGAEMLLRPVLGAPEEEAACPSHPRAHRGSHSFLGAGSTLGEAIGCPLPAERCQALSLFPGRSCGSGGRSNPSLPPLPRWWRRLLTRVANAQSLPCSCCRPSTAGSTELWGQHGRPRSPSCCSTWKVKCGWGGRGWRGEGGQENAAAQHHQQIVHSSPALALLLFPFQGARAEAGGSHPPASIRPREWTRPLMSPRRAGLGGTQGWCLGEGWDWCSWRGCSPWLWRTRSPGQARFAAAVLGNSLGEGLQVGKKQLVIKEKMCVADACWDSVVRVVLGAAVKQWGSATVSASFPNVNQCL